MPKLVGTFVRVVEHDGLKIDEIVGNVSTNTDAVSLAIVTIESPTSEPWLMLHYDEWISVTKGMIELHSENDDGSTTVLKVNQGETAFIAKGERFRPVFPVENTEYIPLCSPAFAPNRCIREEGDMVSDVVAKLNVLHTKEKTRTSGFAGENHDAIDELYHMCEKTLWEQVVASGDAYYPPTFDEDGRYTHATAVPGRLIETGNHFYTSTKGDWICLKLSRSALLKLGIKTVFEEAMPVGATKDDSNWDWICPHMYGGIPTSIDGVVTKTFAIQREEETGKFLSISGLTDV